MRNETNKGEGGADVEPDIPKLRTALNEYFSGHSIALTGLFIFAVI
jgi:hypothetical protein